MLVHCRRAHRDPKEGKIGQTYRKLVCRRYRRGIRRSVADTLCAGGRRARRGGLRVAGARFGAALSSLGRPAGQAANRAETGPVRAPTAGEKSGFGRPGSAQALPSTAMPMGVAALRVRRPDQDDLQDGAPAGSDDSDGRLFRQGASACPGSTQTGRGLRSVHAVRANNTSSDPTGASAAAVSASSQPITNPRW